MRQMANGASAPSASAALKPFVHAGLSVEIRGALAGEGQVIAVG